MPLTYEQSRALARSKGFDPDKVEVDRLTGEVFELAPKEQPTLAPGVPSAQTNKPRFSTAETIGRNALLSVVPSAASIPASIAVGAKVTTATAPFMGPYAAIPGLVAGLGAGVGASFLAQSAQQKLLEQSEAGRQMLQSTAEASEENPIAAAVGNVAGTLPFMRMPLSKENLKMLKDAAGVVTEARMGAGLLNKLSQNQAAQNVLISAGVGGAGSVIEDIQAGKEVNVPKALVNTALQGVVSDVRPWVGKAIPALRGATYQGQPLAEPSPEMFRSVPVERNVEVRPPASPENAAKLQAELDSVNAEITRLDALKAEQKKVNGDVVIKQAELELKAAKERAAELDKQIKGETKTYTELVADEPMKAFVKAKAAEKGVEDVTFTDTGRLSAKSGKRYGSFSGDGRAIEVSTYAGAKDGNTNLPEGVEGVATTGVHETVHSEVYNILQGTKRQQSVGEKLRATVESSPEFAAVVEAQKKAGNAPWDWEEFLTVKAAQDIAVDPANEARSLKNEWKAMSALNSGKGTLDDAIRVLTTKWRYDRGLNAPRGGAGVGTPKASFADMLRAADEAESLKEMNQQELPMSTRSGNELTKLYHQLDDQSNFPPEAFEAAKAPQGEFKFSTPIADESRQPFLDKYPKLARRNENTGYVDFIVEPNKWPLTALADWFGVSTRSISRFANSQGKHIRQIDWNVAIAKDEYNPNASPLRDEGGRVRDEQGNVVMRPRPTREKVDLDSVVGEEGPMPQQHLYKTVRQAVTLALMPVKHIPGKHLKRRGTTRYVANDGKNKWEDSTAAGELIEGVTSKVMVALKKEGLNLKGLENETADRKVFINAARIAERMLRDDAQVIKMRNKYEAISADAPVGEEGGETVGGMINAEDKFVYGNKRASSELTVDEQAKLNRFKEWEASEAAKKVVVDTATKAMQKRVEPQFKRADWEKAWESVLEKARNGELSDAEVITKAKLFQQKMDELGVPPDDTRNIIREGFEELGLYSGTKFSTPLPDGQPQLVTQLSKELAAPRPFGLQVGRDGKLLTSEVIAKLKTLPAIEQDLLDEAGLRDWLAPQSRVDANSVAKWLDENGPKVELLTYGMEGKVSEAKREYDRMTHEWYDGLTATQRRAIELRKGARPESSAEASEMYENSLRSLDKDKLERYIKLWEAQAKDLPDTSPRATSYYDSISAFDTHEPMPEWTTSKEGRNVQRVDVVIPLKPEIPNEYGVKLPSGEVWDGYRTAREAEYEAVSKGGEVVKLKGYRDTPKWQPDNLHENVPNTLGWAMIQYRTGANGERIAVIVEAQSRWGQTLRKELPSKNARLKAYDESVIAKEIPDIDIPEKSSWQLIWKNPENEVKRVIKYDATSAKDAIEAHRAVIDSEFTDHPLLRDYNRLILKAAIDQARKEGATHVMVSDAETALMTEKLDYKAADGTVEREKGFRFNYDNALPRAMRDLTGDEGTRVSLGEHKNARNELRAGDTREELIRRGVGDEYFRDNLIFTNPDGTPKTDVSGTMFDISAPAARLASGEQMTMAGRRFSSPLPEDIDIGPPTDKSRQGLISSLAAQFDQVKKYDARVAEAFAEAELFKDMNEGQYLHTPLADFHRKFGKASELDLKAAYDYALRKYKEDPTLVETDYTTRQKEMAALWNERVSRPIRERQHALKLKVETKDGYRRDATLSEWYAPQMLNDKAIDTFTKSTDTREANRLKEAWIDHIVSESAATDSPVSRDDAQKEITNFIRALGSRGAHTADFGALRKSSGFGLPAEMRETNLLRVMQRYGRRASRDLAKVEGLEVDPYVRNQLALEDPETGEVASGAGDLLAHQEVRDAMKFITGDFEINRSPKLLATSRAVTNAILGPMTGIRDVATAIVNSMPHMSLDDLPLFFTTLSDFQKNRRRSLEVGARTGAHPLDRMDTPLGTDAYVNAANQVGEVLRKYSGRDAIEQFNRIWVFGVGKELAKQAIITNDKVFLDKFGMGAKRGDKWDTDVIAKNFTDRNQGTYGGRGLPAVAVDSAAAPWFSLARWSLEKANTTWNDVLKPAYQGKDFMPLLSYTLGAWLTGEAIERLNESLQGGKKSDLATVDEIEAAGGGIEQRALRLANIMQLGSFLGMTGDLAKMGTDLYQGKTPRGYSVPLADFISDAVVDNTQNFIQAVRDGADPLDAVKNLMIDLSKRQLQAYRVANYWIDREDVERKNKFRDRRVFDELKGRASQTEAMDVNPAFRSSEREFKRETNPEKAAEMLAGLLDKLDTSDPYKLKAQLRRLKQNSYQTMPSPQRDQQGAQEYYNYLVSAYGQEEADKRVEDYVRQTRLNRQKSAAIPSL